MHWVFLPAVHDEPASLHYVSSHILKVSERPRSMYHDNLSKPQVPPLVRTLSWDEKELTYRQSSQPKSSARGMSPKPKWFERGLHYVQQRLIPSHQCALAA